MIHMGSSWDVHMKYGNEWGEAGEAYRIIEKPMKWTLNGKVI